MSTHNNEWTLVSEALPPRIKGHQITLPVMVTTVFYFENGDERRSTTEALFRLDTHEWITLGGGKIAEQVVAWMLKPLPYEGEFES